MVSSWLFLNRFQTSFDVSIVDFKQVNVGWVSNQSVPGKITLVLLSLLPPLTQHKIINFFISHLFSKCEKNSS